MVKFIAIGLLPAHSVLGCTTTTTLHRHIRGAIYRRAFEKRAVVQLDDARTFRGVRVLIARPDEVSPWQPL